ncbi:MAG: type II secretion system GspH family protein [Patescibacteria group bacterium]|nr:type II secretion system GspH family protein [Patescibacteria group bacterium]
MKKTLQNSFTIIETLVAVSILMIAIVGPLTAANKGYSAALESRHRVIAANLAAEELEMLNNFKDNLQTDTSTGKNLFQMAASGDCSSSVCAIYLNNHDDWVVNTSCPSGGVYPCRLYLGSNGYQYSAGGAKLSDYYRYFTLQQVSEDPNQIVVTAITKWYTNRSSTNQDFIALKTVLTNYQK